PPIVPHSFPTRRSSDLECLLGLANVLLVTAKEAAPGAGTANKLEAARTFDILAQGLSTTDFHGAALKIHTHKVGGDIGGVETLEDRKSTRLNSSHVKIS